MKKRAVAVGLEKINDGSVRIRLDDLIQNGEREWLQDVFYTSKDYDVSAFEKLEFEEKELADFGYSIIARLYAFYKRGEVI